MALRRRLAAILAAGVGGCALLSGAADLRTEPDLGSTPQDGSAVDGGLSSDGASPGRDAATDPLLDGAADAPVDGPVGPRVREVRFENGLLGSGGADSVTGMVSLETMAPIDGLRSMTAAPAGGYADVVLAPIDELYATFLVRAKNLGSSPAVFARFSFLGTVATLDLDLTLGITFDVRLGNVLLGSGGNFATEGAVHRMGIHIRRFMGQVKVEVYEGPRGVPFAAAAVTATSAITVGPITRLQVGVVAGGSSNGVLVTNDDIFIDTASMPPP